MSSPRKNTQTTRSVKLAGPAVLRTPLLSLAKPPYLSPLISAFSRIARKNADLKAAFSRRQWVAMNAASGLMGAATSGFLLISFEIGSKLEHAHGPLKLLAILFCLLCATLSAASAYLTFYALREANSFSRQRAEERREALAARRLQESFQPKSLPSPAGFQFAFNCRMCRDIGGDYYDIIELPGGQILLVIADVSGKGMRV